MKDELKRRIIRTSPNAVLVTENMDEALMELSEALGCEGDKKLMKMNKMVIMRLGDVLFARWE